MSLKGICLSMSTVDILLKNFYMRPPTMSNFHFQNAFQTVVSSHDQNASCRSLLTILYLIHTFVNIPALIRKRSVFLSSRAGILTKVWIRDIRGNKPIIKCIVNLFNPHLNEMFNPLTARVWFRYHICIC